MKELRKTNKTDPRVQGNKLKLFRDLTCRIPWERSLQAGGAQETSLISKHKNGPRRRPPGMNMECLAELKPPEMPMEGDHTGAAPQQYRRRPKLSWKTAMGQKVPLQVHQQQKKTKKNRDVLLNRLGRIVTKDMERLKQLMSFWLWSLLATRTPGAQWQELIRERRQVNEDEIKDRALKQNGHSKWI